jgi:hypothetical protein
MSLKPEEQKQLLSEFMGINPEEVESLDQAKQQFNGTFISRAEAFKDPEISSKVAGKITGSIETTLKSTFSDFDWSQEELKGKKIEEKIKAVAGFIGGKMGELSESVKTAASGDVLKVKEEYESQILDWKKKYSDLNGLHTNLKGEYENTIQSYKTKEEQDAIRSEYDSAFKDVPFSPDFIADNLKVKGFTAEFASQFKLAREDGKVLVKDKDGNNLPSKEKAGEFMNVQEALKTFAASANVLQKSPAAGKSTGVSFTPPVPASGTNAPKPNMSEAVKRNRDSILKGMKVV